MLPVVISYTCQSGFDLSYTDNQSTASAVLWHFVPIITGEGKAIDVRVARALATDAAHAHGRGDLRGGGSSGDVGCDRPARATGRDLGQPAHAGRAVRRRRGGEGLGVCFLFHSLCSYFYRQRPGFAWMKIVASGRNTLASVVVAEPRKLRLYATSRSTRTYTLPLSARQRRHKPSSATPRRPRKQQIHSFCGERAAKTQRRAKFCTCDAIAATHHNKMAELKPVYDPIGQHHAIPGGLKQYEAMYKESIDPSTRDEFWRKQSAQFIDWIRPYDRVSTGGFAVGDHRGLSGASSM